MIRALIFDFGGVLVRSQTRIGRTTWDERLHLPHGTIEELFFNSPQGQKAQRGEQSEAQQWAWLGEQFQLSSAELTELRQAFWAGDALNTPLIQFIASLRPTYQTAIISNAMDGLRTDLQAYWRIAHLFDHIVISAEVGVMKPDPTIYQYALQQLNCPPENALFVDDFAHNIAGAQAVGMVGIQFGPERESAELLAELSARLRQ